MLQALYGVEVCLLKKRLKAELLLMVVLMVGCKDPFESKFDHLPLLVTTKAAVDSCSNNGVVLQVGKDLNDNNQLDQSEIQATRESCFPKSKSAKKTKKELEEKVSVVAQVDRGTCLFGGFAVHIGKDRNHNRKLDSSESLQSEMFCDKPKETQLMDPGLLLADKDKKLYLGYGLAMRDDELFVGAPLFGEEGVSKGVLGHYKRNNVGKWIQAGLYFPQVENHQMFGSTVAASSQYVAVGSEGINVPSRVEVFHRRSGGLNWLQELELDSKDTKSGFARRIAMNDRIIVVANLDRDEVFVFEKKGSRFERKARLEVAPDSRDDGRFFGYSLAITNDQDILIGAYKEDAQPGVSSSGVVYVFKKVKSEWVEWQRLIAKTPNSNELFGSAVTAFDSWIAIGASGAQVNHTVNSGRVDVFKKNGDGYYSFQESLVDNKATAHNFFGSGLVFTENVLFVTANVFDLGVRSKGHSYAFKRIGDGWKKVHQLTHDDESFQKYGWALAADKGRFAVSAPMLNANNSSENLLHGSVQGAVYVYEPGGF